MIIITITGTNNSTAQDSYQSVIDREYKIKAVYLYNFCKYVEWPEHSSSRNNKPNDTFIIGLVESDPFGEELAKIARKKTIKGRQIVIRHIDSMEDYQTCHLLFIPANISKDFVKEILDNTYNHSVLIVGEEEGFAQTEGIINFYKTQNKIRFEINPTRAEEHNLKISSKLLKIGRIVD